MSKVFVLAFCPQLKYHSLKSLYLIPLLVRACSSHRYLIARYIGLEFFPFKTTLSKYPFPNCTLMYWAELSKNTCLLPQQKRAACSS